jgi:phage repressor protein C with HTH and peptisase S24 domain
MCYIVCYGQKEVNTFLSKTGRDALILFVQYGHVNHRLRQIRESKDMSLDDVAALWREIMPDVEPRRANAKTIQRFETAARKLRFDQAKKLAKIYEVDLEDIDPDGADTARVPVVGYVGAGEVVHSFDTVEPLEWITPPKRPGAEDTNAVIVRGDSMWPAYKPGDLLFYVPCDTIADNAMDQDCVVRLATGEMYVKTLKRGTAPGRYRLASCRSSVPDIDDVEVAWAAKVRWVERR